MNRLAIGIFWVLWGSFQLFGASGCAGARGALRFDEARYPISLSPFVEDREGRSVAVSDMDTVGQLKIETTVWGIFYSLIPLSGSVDVSSEINRQIDEAGGDAVAMLTVVADQCGVNWAWFFTFIPLWPGCTNVTISGVIVKQKRVSKGQGISRSTVVGKAHVVEVVKRLLRSKVEIAQKKLRTSG